MDEWWWCDDDYYIIFLLLLCLYVVASFKYSRGEGDNLSIHTLELASLAIGQAIFSSWKNSDFKN